MPDLQHVLPGSSIGPYKLVRELGEGGFGVVFLAEQTAPVRRTVALKILKLGMDTRQVVARFEAERQALALMDHPNIARVFDAGATETGRPYFVMEYVEGDPISRYCDANKLSVEERLALFAQVCVAVQHAHSKGLIHRDIKPSNILVGTQDGRPFAKVIDFGIAKAISARLTDKTLFTEEKQVIGTLQYMSPEQAQGSLDVDTRSDVYSLGVVLYELLTGSTPFDTRTMRDAMYSEIQRMIVEDEPPRPSTRLRESGALLADLAAQRRIDPRRLGSLVHGELDWIVMKALEKDRSRRYDTANGLALDVRRYLAGEAVFAVPPSRAYRLRKFVRRNKVVVTASAIVALALILGIVGTTWQAQSAGKQRDIAFAAKEGETKQRKAAEVQRDKAQKVAEFFSSTLKGAGPSVAKGRDITMLKEMMDAAAARIGRGELKDAPEAELSLRSTIGRTYRQLALYPQAAGMVDPILALARSLHEGDHQATALAMNEQALLLEVRGDHPGAEALFRDSLAMLKRLHPEDDPNVASLLNNMAQEALFKDDMPEAERLFREALEMTRRLSPQDRPDMAMGIDNVAKVLAKLGRRDEAEKLMEEALEMRRRIYTGDDPDLATGLSNLAMMLGERGEFERAEKLQRESLEMLKRLTPGPHADVVGCLGNLASLRVIQGDFAGAEPLYREALAMSRQLFPGDHEDVAIVLDKMSQLRFDLGDAQGAVTLGLEAEGIWKRLFPGGHLSLLYSQQNLAAAYWSLGKLDESVPRYEAAVAGFKARYGPENAHTLHAMTNLGVNYRDAGRVQEAIPLLEQAYQASKQKPDLAFAGPALIDAYARELRAGRSDHRDKLGPLALEVVAAARTSQPEGSVQLANTLAQGALALLPVEAWGEAEPMLRECLAIRERTQPDAWTTFNTKSQLGGALLGQKKLDEAGPFLLAGYEGMKAREAKMPRGLTRIPEALERLVRYCEATGDAGKAAEWKAESDARKAAGK